MDLGGVFFPWKWIGEGFFSLGIGFRRVFSLGIGIGRVEFPAFIFPALEFFFFFVFLSSSLAVARSPNMIGHF